MNKELLEFKKNLKLVNRIAIVVLGLIGVLLFTILALLTLTIYNGGDKPDTYAECILEKDAIIQEIYPPKCIVDGEVFIAPIVEDRF